MNTAQHCFWYTKLVRLVKPRLCENLERIGNAEFTLHKQLLKFEISFMMIICDGIIIKNYVYIH